MAAAAADLYTTVTIRAPVGANKKKQQRRGGRFRWRSCQLPNWQPSSTCLRALSPFWTLSLWTEEAPWIHNKSFLSMFKASGSTTVTKSWAPSKANPWWNPCPNESQGGSCHLWSDGFNRGFVLFLFFGHWILVFLAAAGRFRGIIASAVAYLPACPSGNCWSHTTI